MSTPSLALIINTYEQPDYLGRVLRAVEHQTAPPDEVVLADDGSGESTRTLFVAWARDRSFRCHHAWQDHSGFRRSRILNMAIALTQADLLVFLDGDTIPHPAFLSDHRAIARPNRFTQGHRCLVERTAAAHFGEGEFRRDRRAAILAGQLSGWPNAFRWPIPLVRRRTDLRGIRGCNLGIWREDLVRVNGYNEAFRGWGREDSELAVRLMNSGSPRLDVRGRCLCYHLWHPPADRAHLGQNDRQLEEAIQSRAERCATGLDAHLTSA